MAGWSCKDREEIEWDGTIVAKKFKGDGSQLTNAGFPNPANADLDMNSHNIINANSVNSDSIVANTNLILGANSFSNDFELNKATVETVDPPYDAVATIVYDESGSLAANGNQVTFRVYAYRDIGSTRVYSNYVQSNDVIDDSSTNMYYVNLTWQQAGETPDGYKILVYDDQNGIIFDQSFYTDNATFDINYALDYFVDSDAVVTPTSLSSGLLIYTDANYILNSLNGLNFGTSNLGESTFNHPLHIIADHGTEAYPNDGMFVLESNSGSASATFRVKASLNPKFLWENTSADTNETKWQFYASGNGEAVFSCLNDAENSETSYMVVSRTGQTPDLVNFAHSPIKATGYKSSDGSDGISTTITSANLVGKTITVKNGIITGFA